MSNVGEGSWAIIWLHRMNINAYSNDTKRYVIGLKEDEFRELLVAPLLEAMHYRRVRVTHSPIEFGKDIVFQTESPLDGIWYCAVAIKVGPIKGAVDSNHSARTIFHQLAQCLDTPIKIDHGIDSSISKAYLITNNTITQQARESIAGAMRDKAGRITFIDLDDLLTLIRTHHPALLAAPNTEISEYLGRLFQDNCYVQHLRLLGSNRRIALYQCYSGGKVELTDGGSFHKTIGLTVDDVLARSRNLLICGGPGAGKSTLLQRLVLDHVSDSKVRPKQTVVTLPILVRLRDIDRRAVKDLDAFSAYLTAALGSLAAKRSALRSIDGVAIFLDGIDEVANSSLRSSLLHILPSMANNFKISGIPVRTCIVTSRTYAASFIKGFQTAYLSSWSEADLEHFADAWFHGSPVSPAAFFDFITSRSEIQRLAESPLLLTLMAIIFEKRPETFSVTRTAVFEKAIRVLTHEWDAARGIAVDYSEEEIDRVLRALAVRLMETEEPAATDMDVSRCFDQLNQEGVTTVHLKTVAELGERYQRLPLLQYTVKGLVEFNHTSIKEFLVARSVFDSRRDSILIERADDREWWNVVACYYGILRNFALGARELTRVVRRHPLLTLMCLAEADRTPRKTKEEFLKGVVLGLATGKVPFDNEVVPVLRALGEYSMEWFDEMCDSEPVQCDFYIALSDMLCRRADRLSQERAKKVFALLAAQTLSRSQIVRLGKSYVNGTNRSSADLLYRLYMSSGIGIQDEIAPNAWKALESPKRAIVTAMQVDESISARVAEWHAVQIRLAEATRSENDPKGAADLRRELAAVYTAIRLLLFGKRVSPIGLAAGVQIVCRYPLGIPEARRLMALNSSDWPYQRAKGSYGTIIRNLNGSVQLLKKAMTVWDDRQYLGDKSRAAAAGAGIPPELLHFKMLRQRSQLSEGVREYLALADEVGRLDRARERSTVDGR